MADVVCGGCGITLDEIRMGAPLGCPLCYEVFAEELLQEFTLSERVAIKTLPIKKGSCLHTGRRPGQIGEGMSSLQLYTLHQALSETLGREDYEQAALLRDQIKINFGRKGREMTNFFAGIEKPWMGNENSIWLATTLELSRNVDKFHFPTKLDAEKKAHIIQLIYKALTQTDICPGLSLCFSKETPPLDREFLLEHFLIFGHAPQPHPGEAFLFDSSGQFLFILNVRDHLQLFALTISEDLERSWSGLTKIEDALQKTIQFAFSDQFGYLTSDPMHAGTGLIVSAFMHVPALSLENRLADFLEKEQQDAVFALSIYGNTEEYLGDIVVLKNRFTIRVTEEIIISTIHKAALRLKSKEAHIRAELKSNRPEPALDKVSRALGVLQNSFSLGTTESLRALSLVKLGVELGWIQGITLAAVNTLFFECRRAHLARRIGPNLQSKMLMQFELNFFEARQKRYNLCSQCSLPIVVDAPCPGNTLVFAGKGPAFAKTAHFFRLRSWKRDIPIGSLKKSVSREKQSFISIVEANASF